MQNLRRQQLRAGPARVAEAVDFNGRVVARVVKERAEGDGSMSSRLLPMLILALPGWLGLPCLAWIKIWNAISTGVHTHGR